MTAYTPAQLADLEAVRDVGRRYAHCLDRLDGEGLRGVYWPDALDDHGPEFKGNAWEFVEIAMVSHRNWRPSMHCLLNHMVELDPTGRSARGEIYCLAFLFDVQRPVLHMWLGRYLDRYEKRGDEWRIIERVTVHEGSRTDDPVTPMPFDLGLFVQGSFDRPSSGRPIGPPSGA